MVVTLYPYIVIIIDGCVRMAYIVVIGCLNMVSDVKVIGLRGDASFDDMVKHFT